MKKYSLGNHIGYLLKGIWESNRGLMALLIVETVCSVITPYIAMYLPKIGVDLATNGASVRRAAALLLAITCVLVLSQGLGSMASRGKDEASGPGEKLLPDPAVLQDPGLRL